MFEKKIKDFNFYGCEDFKDKIEDEFLDRLEEMGEELADLENHIDSELEDFDFEEAYREEEKNEAIDRAYEEARDRDIMKDFYLTR